MAVLYHSAPCKEKGKRNGPELTPSGGDGIIRLKHCYVPGKHWES
jgi:hypothetical protein